MDREYRIVYRYTKDSYDKNPKTEIGKASLRASDLYREGASGVVKAIEKAAGIPALSAQDSSPLWDDEKISLLSSAIEGGEYALAYPAAGLMTHDRRVVTEPDFESVLSSDGFSLHFDYEKKRTAENYRYKTLPERMRSSYSVKAEMYDKDRKLSPKDLKDIIDEYKDEGMGK